MTIITDVYAREVLDSRGNPTVEVEVYTRIRCIWDARLFQVVLLLVNMKQLNLRDGDKIRYMGKGVLKAVENVNEIIAPEIIGLDVT